ncbi:hypothetical protein LGT39_02885, partial [Demequina sp. TTPB684]
YGKPTKTPVDVVLDQRPAFDPGGSREPVEVGRTQTVTTPKLYFVESVVDIADKDEVLIAGKRYTVQGDPADWPDPFGSEVGGVVVELQRVDG